jgi:hypothetical protein
MNVNELNKDMHVFCDTRRQLPPMRTEALTQLGRGTFNADINVFTAPEATLYIATVNTRSSTLADLHEDYTAFVFPLSWQGEFVINGEEVNASSIYAPVDGTLFQVYGDQRETVAVALPREDFLATIAALNGVDVDGVQFNGGPIEAAASLMRSARRTLSAMIGLHPGIALQQSAARCRGNTHTQHSWDTNRPVPAIPAGACAQGPCSCQARQNRSQSRGLLCGETARASLAG